MVSLEPNNNAHYSPAHIYPGLSANSDHIEFVSHKWWQNRRKLDRAAWSQNYKRG